MKTSDFLFGFMLGAAVIGISILVILAVSYPTSEARGATSLGSDDVGTIYEGGNALFEAPLPCAPGDLYFDNALKILNLCKTDWKLAHAEDWKRYWLFKNAQLEQKGGD